MTTLSKAKLACRYLAKYDRILVIISHSQDFMNGVCTNVLHMQKKKINIYSGNYDTFVTSRAQLEDQQMKKYNWEQEQARAPNTQSDPVWVKNPHAST